MSFSNNFATWEECQRFCTGVGPIEEQPQQIQYPQQIPTEVRRIDPEPRFPHQQPLDHSSSQGKPTSFWNTNLVWLSKLTPSDCLLCLAEEERARRERQRDEALRLQRERAEEEKRRAQEWHEEQLRLRAEQDQRRTTSSQQIGSDRNTRCRLPVDAGTCKDGYLDAWHFDYYTGQCYKFIYSGCGGNANRFGSKAECEQVCGHLAVNSGGYCIYTCLL